jgi:cytochrome b
MKKHTMKNSAQSASNRRRVLVWDLPTRLFHWLLAGGFLAAAFISLVLGEDHQAFPYHAIIGLTLGLMVALRLMWGFIGPRYARLKSFVFSPAATIEYFQQLISRGTQRHTGHNPGSALGIFAMFGIVIGLAVTGIMLGQGNESVEDLHNILAYSMLIVVGGHVLGVVIHTVIHRENIAASMVHGRKDIDPGAGIQSPSFESAVVFLVICTAWSLALLKNYDGATQSVRLPLFGTTLTLGEGGEGSGEDDD